MKRIYKRANIYKYNNCKNSQIVLYLNFRLGFFIFTLSKSKIKNQEETISIGDYEMKKFHLISNWFRLDLKLLFV
jgi:hypothetical protein